jgi:glycosyltransferase 2 family protein
MRIQIARLRKPADPRRGPERGEDRRSGRPLLGALLGLALSGLALLFVGIWEEELPRRIEAVPLLLALAAIVTAYMLQAAMLVVLLRPQLGKVRIREMAGVYTAAVALGYMTPFGGAEMPYQVYAFHRRGLPVGAGSAVVITKGILSVSVLVSGALLGLLLLPAAALPETRALVAAALFMVALWAAFGFLLGRAPRRTEAGDTAGSQRWPRRFFSDLREGFMILWRRQPRSVAACAGLMVLYWAVTVCVGPLALMAAGWSGAWAPIVVDQLVLWALLPLSPTPGGSGVAELGFAAFVGHHASGGVLIGGLLIWRTITYLLPLLVGAFLAGYDLADRGPNHGLSGRAAK